VAEPWGGTLPVEVKNQIDELFSRSEPSRRIAYTLMFYNHRPTVKEMKQIGDAAGRSSRTVQDVIRRLSDNSLFTSELGSVPLYRHIGKIGASKTMGGIGLMGATGEVGKDDGGEEYEPNVQPDTEDEEAPMDDGDAELETLKAKAGSPADMGEINALREEVSRMDQRQDKLEAMLDAGFKDVLARLREKEPASPLVNPNVMPEVAVNPLSVDPPEEPEELEQEPVEADEGPFAGMTKEQVIDMAINSPEMVYALRNQGVPPTSDTIQAVPHTTRWLALELTTYTQAAYERSVEDGYEGSLSDFINNAVYKYFADRGKVLQWVDTIPRPPLYYPQPPAYPRKLGD